MSFGKRKMQAVADELAPNVSVCDHRGSGEWMVAQPDGTIHYGCEGATSSSRFSAKSLAEISDHYRPWAKRVMKSARHG